MADKGKGKAVDDTARTSSRTSGRTETAGGGGTQQEPPLGASFQFSGAPGGGGGSGLYQSQLRLQTPTTVQQPLSNQARGSAPFGGQNQIANPQFAGGGGGGGSGAGFGGFSQSQFAHGHGGLHSRPPAAMLQPTLGNNPAGGSGSAALGIHAPSGQNGNSQLGGGGGGGGGGHGGFSQPAPVGNPAFVFGEPSTSAAASLERECTICKVATSLLWNVTTVQGTPLPICWDCYRKIFAGGRPLDHLEQYLASTAVGGGGGSIPEFLAAHGHGGGYSQWAANPVTSPLLWCVNCNFLAELLWDNLPMCWPCYGQSLDKMAVYEYLAVDQALAQIRADKARAHQEVAEALAQGRSILTGPRRQLDHGQSSSAPPPHAQAQGRCHRCGAPEPTRRSQGGFPVCELCFNN